MSFKIFNRKRQLFLSDVDPILENLGLKIISEKAFPLRGADGRGRVWLHDFSLYRARKGGSRLQPAVMRGFEEAFRAVWQRRVDDDRFNALVITAGLDWREAALLRAYSAYLKQIKFDYRPEFVADTLNAHPRLSRQLVAYFNALLAPDSVQRKDTHAGTLKRRIMQDIDKVVNLSEDSVLRMMLNLMDATLRTNYFQRAADGALKDYFAFKLDPQAVEGMPLPKPRFEIFVYARTMEGVHLRGGAVARGGLRWSDRSEDYRTEVLGLVKAQQVKNAVIVPVGAKGCFVVKQSAEADPDPVQDRQRWQQRGLQAYETFISGMLDVTDNRSGEGVTPPPEVRRRDGDDPYLVVAADKGTATFSDAANRIAARYGFWLGDGFASGGSNGYDHKAMGITAKGAWVSVRRHFRELGVDVQKEDFSVLGIGDMSGDVFGNGMLLSRHIRLLAAFNHLHIFVDPAPDAAVSFEERQRLFDMPRSTWRDYNPELISEGGGVFERGAKWVPISPQMQERFGIKAERLTPDRLIRALLRAEVDLLWNGGIGTYVKAAGESHSDVGDKANDTVRVDAGELRCRVVGEGGNLGLTQRARVEYGLKGGISITDFVDNSAGVDCSDHEVNIKILLSREVEQGRLSMAQRNELLQAMTDEVARLVLHNNKHQVLSISIANAQMAGRAKEYAELIAYLEQHGGLDRSLEALPGRDEMEERIAKRLYLTRPEIAVLTSYTKMFLKLELPEADYIDDGYLAPFLFSEFPEALAADHREAVLQHPLRRQIIATQLANNLVNLAGPSFFYRMSVSTGSTPAEVVKAALFSREVLRFGDFWRQAERLDFIVPGSVQIDVLSRLARLMRRVTRWLLRNRRGQLRFEDIPDLRRDIDAVRDMLPVKLPTEIAEKFLKRQGELVEAGIPEEQARGFVSCEYIPAAITFVDVSHSSRAGLAEVMDYYYGVNEALELHWLVRVLNQLPVGNHWQALARETYLDELAGLQRGFCHNAVTYVTEGGTLQEDVAAGITDWMERHSGSVRRVRELMARLRAGPQQDYAVYAVILRELQALADATGGATRSVGGGVDGV